MSRCSLLVVLGLAVLAVAEPSVFDAASDCGAVGDAKTLNTAVIQKCIESAYQSAEGGVVVFPAGTYLTGRIVLRSGVTLRLQRGATLLGSTRPEDYSTTDPSLWALVHALGEDDIAIEGEGTIDGQAVPAYVDHWDGDILKLLPHTWEGVAGCVGECRPRLVQLIRCTRVRVVGVTLTNSPDWTLHALGCKDVHFANLTILGNNRWPNNDAIDPDSCQNVVIENCHLDVGDDGVCLKSTKGYGPTKNVYVRNVTIHSRSSAIKFGSTTEENIEDVLMENIYIYDSNRGIGLQQRDAGNINNVTFRNIVINNTRYWPDTWWGSAEPIWVSSTERSTTAKSGSGKTTNVLFEDIVARSENGVLLSGRLDHRGQSPAGITFRRVSINIARYSNVSLPRHEYRPCSPPDFVPGPVDGFYFENVESATLEDVSVTFESPAQDYYGECFVKAGTTTDTSVDLTSTTCNKPPVTSHL